MNQNEMKTAERIRRGYTPAEKTKLDELRELDRKVRRPADIFAYIFGSVGSLVLGTGMCLAMGVIGGGAPLMIGLGIGIGCLGIAGAAANYPIYKKILTASKNKYAADIIKLAGEIAEEE